jgi:glutamate racemase
MTRRPVAMFDSGFGGLTVARAVIDLLPEEDLVYFGDTGRYPYGTKSPEEVRSHAMEIARLLRDRYDIKMLVVACNTAAAVALDDLRAELDVPVIGVIDPGLRACASVTSTGRVGVIATVGTVASGGYERAAREWAPDVDMTVAACPGFVEFVERGELDSPQVHVLAERLLAPIRDAKVDTLLLGCTHYPYLARTISDVMGRDVVLVSSADETAFEIRGLLRSDSTARRTGSRTFLSSGDANAFERLGRQLFGEELIGAEQHHWGAS